MLFATNSKTSQLLLGSGNFTRRNLNDYNLETDLYIRGQSHEKVLADAEELFSIQWSNLHGQSFSVEYKEQAREKWWLNLQYRIMEASGISTF